MRSEVSLNKPILAILCVPLIGALGASALSQTTEANGKSLLHMGETVPSGCVAIIDGARVTEEQFIDEFLRAFGGPGRGGADVRKNLLGMGHRLAPRPRGIGRCQAIGVLRDGTRVGVADPRSAGTALAY